MWIRIQIFSSLELCESDTTGLQTLQGSISNLHAFTVSVHGPPRPLKLLNFDFNADPDPTIYSNTDPDPASQNNSDPVPQFEICKIFFNRLLRISLRNFTQQENKNQKTETRCV
jgi:hypothetical protein